MSRRCHCEHDWPLREDDVFCGQCGRALAGLYPVAPVSLPDILIVYLSPAMAAQVPLPTVFYTGKLTFQLFGGRDMNPSLRWTARGHPGLWLSGHRPGPGNTLELDVEIDTLARHGLLGEARLTLDVAGLPRDFLVQGFRLPSTRPDAWLTFRIGERPVERELVVYWDSPPGVMFLEAVAGEGVPVQWESVECDHPAVTVRLVEPGKPGDVVRALVQFRPNLLSDDPAGEDVVFHIGFRNMAPWDFVQRVVRRARFPLHCRPAGIRVASLLVGQTQREHVEISNADRQPLVLRRIDPEVSWVKGDEVETPLRLEPGDRAMVPFEVRTEWIENAGPLSGRVVFHLDGRGRQTFPVRIDRIHRPRRMDSPLLLDPGPPRIVLGTVDAETGRVVHLAGSSDNGLSPEEFGIDPTSYTQAVHSPRAVLYALHQVLSKARDLVRDRDHLEVRKVLLCRQPWCPREVSWKGVRVIGWAELCRRVTLLPCPILRLEAWGSDLLEGDELPRALDGPWSCLGSSLVGGILQEFFRAGVSEKEMTRWLNRPGDMVPAGRRPLPGWLRLACDELLRDHGWGVSRAWRRWIDTWRRHVPASRRVPLDPVRCERHLHLCLTEYARSVGHEAVRSLSSTASPMVVLSPVCASAPLARALQRAFEGIGARVEAVAPRWLEWLGAALVE